MRWVAGVPGGRAGRDKSSPIDINLGRDEVKKEEQRQTNMGFSGKMNQSQHLQKGPMTMTVTHNTTAVQFQELDEILKEIFGTIANAHRAGDQLRATHFQDDGSARACKRCSSGG
jgi:hypothetical protein